MPLEQVEQTTVDFYDAGAADWAGQHSAFQQNFWEGGLAKFRELLPHGKILEVGSGGGRDAKLLIEQGYDYVGTDISAGLLEVARENNPSALFLHQSVYDLDFPENEFDGFWAVAVLLHVVRSRIQEALARIVYVCKDGAIGYIGVKEGDVIEEDERGKRLFTYFTQDEFAAELQQAGLEIVNFEYHPVTERTKWLKYVVRVRK